MNARRVFRLCALSVSTSVVACISPRLSGPESSLQGFPDAQWVGFFSGTLGSRQFQTGEKPRLHVCDSLAARLLQLPETANRIRGLVDSVSYGAGGECLHPTSRKVRTLLVIEELHFDSNSAWAVLYAEAYGGFWRETWRAGTLGRRFFSPWTISMSVFTPS